MLLRHGLPALRHWRPVLLQ